MALTDDNSMVMPVSPYYGGNGNNDGFGGNWAWIILLLLLGWGNNGWNNGNGGGAGYGAGGLYPWMNQASLTTDGFQNQLMNDNITEIRSGVSNLSTQLCNSIASVNATINSGFSNAESSANARQIANMQQAFNSQTAITSGLSNLASQFADCCCENRLAACQTQNIIQNEGNQTRFADANNTRDLLTNQTANTQAILDKLCQLELDGYKRENDSLRTQLTAANFRESQAAQNNLITQGFANEVDQLYNRLNSCPVPTTPVYGRTPIFTCNQNSGCGCACGA